MAIGHFWESAFLLVGGALAIWFVLLLDRRLMSRTPVRWRGWGICFVLWLAVFFVLPNFSCAQGAARRAMCACNLSNLGKALLNYESKHGRFLPAYSTDKDGRPLHSWRVLILPYIEHENLCKRLRLDEPWDSPHNRAVFDANPMPPFFACPEQRHVDGKDTKNTSYVMVVGPGTMSDGANSVQMKQITDGPANTITVVEVADSGIHWAEPRDLKADEMSYRINDPDNPSIGSHHRGGAHAAFADGSVRFLEDATDPETVKAPTTIAGGEDVSEFIEEWITRAGDH